MENATKALILGGTSGLGGEIALIFKRGGAQVFVLGREPRDTSTGTHLFCDLASEASVRKLLVTLEAEDSKAPFTHFFWVAGYLKRAGFAQSSPEDILRTVDVNFRNPLLLAQWMWQRMTSRTVPQTFAVISSTAGISDSPREDEAVYAATKTAQVSFARAIGKNCKTSALRVGLFCPGGMKTGLWNDNPNDAFATFMDPGKVAQHIVDKLRDQADSYSEVVIPRGQFS